MHEKLLAILALAALGIVAFPLAIASHLHFFGDGVAFFAWLVETQRPTTGHVPARYLANTLTSALPVLAMRLGIRDLTTLSYIYGASLYYLPLAGFATAAYLLFRKGRNAQATLLVLMYLLLIALTSYFIISESHLAAAMFVLTLAILATCDLYKPAPLAALLVLGLISASIYEFWVVFFPVCLAMFLHRVWGRPVRPVVRCVHILLVLVYVGGTVFHAGGILFPHVDLAPNRNAMFSTDLRGVWPFFLGGCVLFGLAVWYERRRALASGSASTGPSARDGAACRWWRPVAMAAVLVGVASAASALLHVHEFETHSLAYAMRPLNLCLPLLFVLSLVRPPEAVSSIGARRLAMFVVLPVLVFTLQDRLLQTHAWRDYIDSVQAAHAGEGGYTPVQEADLHNRSFLWGWTSPVLSLVLQSMNGGDVRSILYNPQAEWEPYCPHDRIHAERITHRLGGVFLVPEVGRASSTEPPEP